MQQITWGELIGMLVVGWIGWYLVVLARYYRADLVRRFKSKQPGTVKWNREPVEQVADVHGGQAAGRGNEDLVHVQVHELIEELKLVFTAAVEESLSKEQILQAIQFRFSKYTSLPDRLRVPVNQHIVNEFSLQLKISVSDKEIASLW